MWFSIFFLFISTLPLLSLSTVPPSETFSYINEGEFGDYISEYDATYRTSIRIFRSPFQLMFYNTTPNAYTLALRMGTVRASSEFYWVWEANRGNPVRENATFSLLTNGNLVLADPDGRVAWHSDTADKGVVGFDLLPNGNMVLLNAQGGFVWQSFEHPTDTLLVGQTLRSSSRLVSRLSITQNANGPYSLVLEPEANRLGLYYTSQNSKRSVRYYQIADFDKNALQYLTFNSTPEMEFSDRLVLHFNNNSEILLSKTNYNSTLSFLRLGIDGNLKAFTFYDKVDHVAWEETFTLFRREFGGECRLPGRCGSLGLCEDSQCVGCPTPGGVVGWSMSCAPPKLTSCKAEDVRYFKLEGVDHFTSRYGGGSGGLKEEECSAKCTSDCKCLGFFFKRLELRCWIVYDLMTIRKVGNSTHVGYIKTPVR